MLPSRRTRLGRALVADWNPRRWPNTAAGGRVLSTVPGLGADLEYFGAPPLAVNEDGPVVALDAGEYIATPSPTTATGRDWRNGSQWTIEALFTTRAAIGNNPSEFVDDVFARGYRDSSSNGAWELGFNAGDFYILEFRSDFSFIAAGTAGLGARRPSTAAGVRHHVVGTSDFPANFMRFYYNGLFAEEALWSAGQGPLAITAANGIIFPVDTHVQQLDWSYLRIYNRALTHEECARLFTDQWAPYRQPIRTFFLVGTPSTVGSGAWASSSSWSGTGQLLNTGAWSSASSWSAVGSAGASGQSTHGSSWTALAPILGTGAWSSSSSWSGTASTTLVGAGVMLGSSVWASAPGAVLIGTGAWSSAAAWGALLPLTGVGASSSSSSWSGAGVVATTGSGAWSSSSSWNDTAVLLGSGASSGASSWSGAGVFAVVGTGASSSSSSWAGTGVVPLVGTGSSSSSSSWAATVLAGVPVTWVAITDPRGDPVDVVDPR